LRLHAVRLKVVNPIGHADRRNFFLATRVRFQTVEDNMPLSLSSYLLGVGTVVGALAFGFGGGVFLTHTAMKQTPVQTRLERLARAEPEASAVPQASAAQVNPPPNQASVGPNPIAANQDRPAAVDAVKQATAPVEQSAANAPDPAPAVQAETPKPDAAREPESPRQVQATKDDPASMNQRPREPQLPKQIERNARAETKPVESREPDHRAERSARRYAERKQPDIEAPRMRQRRFIVQEEPAQEVVDPSPPQQHFDLLGGIFGHPSDTND
jgi:hypothetical protein